MDAARKSFGNVIDTGLDNKRLGVKFLFRPGTAALWVDPKAGPLPYPLWLNEIASRRTPSPYPQRVTRCTWRTK